MATKTMSPPTSERRHLKHFGTIPAHWEDAPIGKLFKVQLGKMLSQKSKTGTNYRPYLGNWNVQWGAFDLSRVEEMDFDEREFTKFQLRSGDLLVCEGGEVGRTAIWNGEITNCCYQKALHRLRPKNGDILPQYFRYYMEEATRQQLFLRYTNETSIAHLSRETLIEVVVPVPPVDEQETIVDVLSGVDDAIAATRAVIEQTRKLKTALLQDIFTNGLPDRHTQKQEAKYLGRLPRDWKILPIGDVFHVELGKMLSQVSKSGKHYRPYLGNSNVKWGRFDLRSVEQMDFKDVDLPRYQLRKGDVLICEGGEVGRTAVWDDELPLCCYQKAIHRLRPRRTDSILPKFMRYFMEHAVRCNLMIRFTGESSIAHLTRETLVQIPMPLPHIDEQREIVKILEAVQSNVQFLELREAGLYSLKTALSQGLLTGRIPVSGGCNG